MNKKYVLIAVVVLALAGIFLFLSNGHGKTPAQLRSELSKKGYEFYGTITEIDRGEPINMGVLGKQKAQLGELVVTLRTGQVIFFYEYGSAKEADKYCQDYVEEYKKRSKFRSWTKSGVNVYEFDEMGNDPDNYMMISRVKNTMIIIGGKEAGKDAIIALAKDIGYYK